MESVIQKSQNYYWLMLIIIYLYITCLVLSKMYNSINCLNIL